MARKKAIVILPHLIDSGGNMTKEWWVEYSFRNPKTGVMQRFRNYTLFTNVPTVKSRYSIWGHLHKSVDMANQKIMFKRYIKNGKSLTPINFVLNPFVFEFRNSVAAFVDLFIK